MIDSAYGGCIPRGEQLHSAPMTDTCVICMLLAPVMFSTSTPTIYVWSGNALGHAEVVTSRIGLTSYLRVTLVEWNGASLVYGFAVRKIRFVWR